MDALHAMGVEAVFISADRPGGAAVEDAFRVRLRTANGEDWVAFQQTISAQQSTAWQTLLIPLSQDNGVRATTILLDVRAPEAQSAYWAIPTLVGP